MSNVLNSGAVVWLTGLPGSGKTTLSLALSAALKDSGLPTQLVDGDVLRATLNSDLGFSHRDRSENTRRAGDIAALAADAGLICIVSLISPYKADRARARQVTQSRFIEVYLSTSVQVCEARDPKGLYAQARAGLIQDFTGISAPYEAPEHCEIQLDTELRTLSECVEILKSYIVKDLQRPTC